LPGTGPARKAIDGILEAGERAKNLVGRMLAFARAEEPATAPVQVGPIVHEAVGLLRPMLPSHLELLVDEATGTPAALVDPAQLQHALVSLVTNASQSIRGGAGTIRVEINDR